MEIEIDYNSNGSIDRKYPIQKLKGIFLVGMIQTYKIDKIGHEIRQSIFFSKDRKISNIHGSKIIFKY